MRRLGRRRAVATDVGAALSGDRRRAGADFAHPLNKVAGKFPDVKFEHATGYKREHPNVATYNSKFHEGRYIQGVIAAKESKTGVAGYIASFPIPEVVMGINSFMLGAQSVNPDFKVKVVWANTWFDAGKEADAAKALIDQGVDIITQHTDSTAPMQVATERGIKAFGQASDMIKFGPTTQLTSIVDDWGPYYIERIKVDDKLGRLGAFFMLDLF
jgi:basic membrane protein A